MVTSEFCFVPELEGHSPDEAVKANFQPTQSYGITLALSSKDEPNDDTVAENIFSILKTDDGLFLHTVLAE